MRNEQSEAITPFKPDSKIEKGTLLETKVLLESYLAKSDELISRWGMTPDLAAYMNDCRELITSLDTINDRLTNGESKDDIYETYENFVARYEILAKKTSSFRETFVMPKSDPSIIAAPGTDTLQ